MIPPVNPDLLTETDKFALSKMPSGRWFDSDFLSPAIRRPHYRCDRLHKLGYLEYKVIGEWPNLESRYRKKKQLRG